MFRFLEGPCHNHLNYDNNNDHDHNKNDDENNNKCKKIWWQTKYQVLYARKFHWQLSLKITPIFFWIKNLDLFDTIQKARKSNETNEKKEFQELCFWLRHFVTSRLICFQLSTQLFFVIKRFWFEILTNLLRWRAKPSFRVSSESWFSSNSAIIFKDSSSSCMIAFWAELFFFYWRGFRPWRSQAVCRRLRYKLERNEDNRKQ